MGWPKCNTTVEDETITEIDLWDGGITFHHLCLIVGGVFALIAGAISLFLIMCHARHYSKPIEQRHIIRILFMIPVYAFVSWIGTLFYKNSVYYEVIRDCYEAFTISAFFSLMCHYIAPDLHNQKEYFRGIAPKPWLWPLTWFKRCCGGERGVWRTPRSGLTWFNIIWVSVFQYCLLRVLMTIVAVITQHFNLYCEESLNPAFSHIWVMVIECAAVTIAMYCLIQFYYQVKDDIQEHRPFMKILSIKLVIFLSFWQTTLISFLFSSGVIKSSKKIQEPDLKVGLPNLLVCVEMALFSVLHLWSFPWKPYTLEHAQLSEVTDFYGNGKPTYQGGRFGLKALIDVFNPIDLIKAVSRSFRWLFVGRRKRTLDPSYHQAPDDTDAIGLTVTGPNGTSYEGAGGAAMMAGGRTGRSDSAGDEEGAVLLSHPQPTGYSGRHSPGLAPSPYDEELHGPGYFPQTNRPSSPGVSLLEPAGTHSPRPYSPYAPYDDSNNPYLMPSPLDPHAEAVAHNTSITPPPPFSQHENSGSGSGSAPYPTGGLQEQPPIPLPESYQPPPLHYDGDYSRR